jgi:hypothetical protein
MKSKKIVVPLVAIVMVASSIISITSVSADTHTSNTFSWRKKSISGNQLKGIMGTVTAVNGSIITVLGKDNTSYTVDASTAKIRGNAGVSTSTLADLKVGDMIVVKGSITGASITAATIIDDVQALAAKNTSKKLPVIIGTVTGISSTTLAVMSTTTKKSTTTTTYVVDASAAKIMKGATTTATFADIKLGDTVFVRGSINGTTVAATAIIDGPIKGNKGKGSMKGTLNRFFHWKK